jgi:hypothetical protein
MTHDALSSRLTEILERSPRVWEVLTTARDLDFPDWLLVSGAVYQTVWNSLTDRHPDYGIKDYDLLYFDQVGCGPLPDAAQHTRRGSQSGKSAPMVRSSFPRTLRPAELQRRGPQSICVPGLRCWRSTDWSKSTRDRRALGPSGYFRHGSAPQSPKSPGDGLGKDNAIGSQSVARSQDHRALRLSQSQPKHTPSRIGVCATPRARRP